MLTPPEVMVRLALGVVSSGIRMISYLLRMGLNTLVSIL